MKQQQKDHTGCLIAAVVIGIISFALFGTALEVLKFMALIKWIFA
jgi:hypothetical protein